MNGVREEQTQKSLRFRYILGKLSPFISFSFSYIDETENNNCSSTWHINLHISQTRKLFSKWHCSIGWKLIYNTIIKSTITQRYNKLCQIIGIISNSSTLSSENTELRLSSIGSCIHRVQTCCTQWARFHNLFFE